MTRPARVVVAVVMALLVASLLGMLMGVLVAFTAPVAAVDPGARARVLAETIVEAMNCLAMFPIYTVPVAVFLAWKGADTKTATRVSLAALAGLLGGFAAALAWFRVWGPATPIAFGAALYRGAMLAGLAVPAACAIAWRAGKRPEAE